MKFRLLFFLFLAFGNKANAQLRELGGKMTQEETNENNAYKLEQYKELLKQIQAGKKEIPADQPDFEQAITNGVAWHQLLTGDFKGAEKTLNKGLKKVATYEYFLSNYPPALLFQGKYKEAKKAYAALKDTEMKVLKKSYKEVFLEDLAEIEKTGFVAEAQKEDLAKMRAFLKE